MKGKRSVLFIIVSAIIVVSVYSLHKESVSAKEIQKIIQAMIDEYQADEIIELGEDWEFNYDQSLFTRILNDDEHKKLIYGVNNINIELDSSGGKRYKFTKKVVVLDTTKPTITGENVTLVQGDEYSHDQLSVNVVDNSNDELDITYVGDVDTNTPGEYSVKVIAKDIYGNEDSVVFRVVVEIKPEVVGTNEVKASTNDNRVVTAPVAQNVKNQPANDKGSNNQVTKPIEGPILYEGKTEEEWDKIGWSIINSMPYRFRSLVKVFERTDVNTSWNPRAIGWSDYRKGQIAWLKPELIRDYNLYHEVGHLWFRKHHLCNTKSLMNEFNSEWANTGYYGGNNIQEAAAESIMYRYTGVGDASKTPNFNKDLWDCMDRMYETYGT